MEDALAGSRHPHPRSASSLSSPPESTAPDPLGPHTIKFAHVVLRTGRFREMLSWWQTVLEAEARFENEFIAFLSYDDEHHRIALIAIPVSVGLARGARGARGSPHWLRSAIVFGAGAWVVALGYFMVAHAVDPCVNGWWDADSRIGDQPLCERFGAELNWHTRFHLLAHAAPAASLLAVYIWSIRRWATPADPTAEHKAHRISIDS